MCIWTTSCCIEVLDSMHSHPRQVTLRNQLLEFMHSAWTYHYPDAVVAPFPDAWRRNAARDNDVQNPGRRLRLVRHPLSRDTSPIDAAARRAEVSQQTGGVDCGLFVVAFMRAVATGAATESVDSVIAFCQQNVLELRQQLLTQYLELAILDDVLGIAPQDAAAPARM